MMKCINNVIMSTNNFSIINGTSKLGSISLRYKDIVMAFGDPISFDDYKVSGEWVFQDDETGAVFTLYDWKSTYLYDPGLPSVEEFRALEYPVTFNIGGNGKMSVEEFKSLLVKQIEYVKRGENHLDQMLFEHSVPYISCAKVN